MFVPVHPLDRWGTLSYPCPGSQTAGPGSHPAESTSTAGRPYASTSFAMKIHRPLTFSPASGRQSPMALLYVCPAHLAGFGTPCISLGGERSAHHTEPQGPFPNRKGITES